MIDSTDSLPSREQELILHGRLVDRDATASAELAEAYLDHLICWLAQRNRLIPEEIRSQGAEDAILSLIKSPHSYDPSRQSLAVYLRVSALGDMRNHLQKEINDRKNLESWDRVELSPMGRKNLERDDDPSLPLRIREEVEAAEGRILPAVEKGLTEGERAVLDLMLKGERKTAIFAEAYRIGHLPKPEQFETVKRVKDKLKKRIERARPENDQ